MAGCQPEKAIEPRTLLASDEINSSTSSSVEEKNVAGASSSETRKEKSLSQFTKPRKIKRSSTKCLKK